MRQAVLEFLLFGAIALIPAVAEQVRAKLPGKDVEVSVALEDFHSTGVESVPGKTLLYGKIENGKVNFSFVFDEGQEVETGDKFRALWKKNWKPQGAQEFEAKEWSCLELTEPLPAGFQDLHYHAFRGIPGIGLHVHVSFVYSKKRPFERSRFLELLGTIQVLDHRNELTFPKVVGDFLAESSQHGPDTLAWIREQCRSRPDDYVPHQALGMMAFDKHDPAGTLEGFGRSTELLWKKEALADDEKFALEDAEFCMGWALHEKGEFAGALPHAQKAYELSGLLKIRGMHGESTYALACCHGLLSDAANAAKYLKEAIALDAKYRDEAKKDKDFDKVRKSAEFRKALAP